MPTHPRWEMTCRRALPDSSPEASHIEVEFKGTRASGSGNEFPRHL